MLLQIAEPGESKVKEACKKRVVGIDLGTTNSLVAHVADSSPEVIDGSGGPNIADVVTMALRFQGFAVETAGTGAEALAAVG